MCDPDVDHTSPAEVRSPASACGKSDRAELGERGRSLRRAVSDDPTMTIPAHSNASLCFAFITNHRLLILLRHKHIDFNSRVGGAGIRWRERSVVPETNRLDVAPGQHTHF